MQNVIILTSHTKKLQFKQAYGTNLAFRFPGRGAGLGTV